MIHPRGLLPAVACLSLLPVVLPAAPLAGERALVTAHPSWSQRIRSHPTDPGPYGRTDPTTNESGFEIHIDGRLIHRTALDWFLCVRGTSATPPPGSASNSDRPGFLRASGSGSSGSVQEAPGPGSSTLGSLTPLQEDPREVLRLTGSRVFPNPFNPFLTDAIIAFDINQDATVVIAIYDWSGRLVSLLQPGALPAGANEVRWGGQARDGTKLGNGTYLVRVMASTPARQEAAVLKAVVWND